MHNVAVSPADSGVSVQYDTVAPLARDGPPDGQILGRDEYDAFSPLWEHVDCDGDVRAPHGRPHTEKGDIEGEKNLFVASLSPR